MSQPLSLIDGEDVEVGDEDDKDDEDDHMMKIRMIMRRRILKSDQ